MTIMILRSKTRSLLRIWYEYEDIIEVEKRTTLKPHS